MSLYQLISEILVGSWILHAVWGNRWVGVCAWFSAVGCIPGRHSLATRSKTANISNLLDRMMYLLLNPMKQTRFNAACIQVLCLRNCFCPSPGILPMGFPFLSRLLCSLWIPCPWLLRELCLYNNSVLSVGLEQVFVPYKSGCSDLWTLALNVAHSSAIQRGPSHHYLDTCYLPTPTPPADLLGEGLAFFHSGVRVSLLKGSQGRTGK